jgi:CubicO group peptidase (beta-lactamase class C family)
LPKCSGVHPPDSAVQPKISIKDVSAGGAGGAFFFIDPKDDMFTICLMQAPSQSERIRTDLKTLIYEALNR